MPCTSKVTSHGGCLVVCCVCLLLPLLFLQRSMMSSPQPIIEQRGDICNELRRIKHNLIKFISHRINSNVIQHSSGAHIPLTGWLSWQKPPPSEETFYGPADQQNATERGHSFDPGQRCNPDLLFLTHLSARTLLDFSNIP